MSKPQKTSKPNPSPQKAVTHTLPPLQAFFSRHTLLKWLAFFIGAAVYLNTVGHKFTMDDASVITNNTYTKRGASGITGHLSHDMFYGFFNDTLSVVAGSRYRPLTPAMFCMEAEIFAKPLIGANGQVVQDMEGYALRDLSAQGGLPSASHSINIILYGLLCLFIYLLLLELLNPSRDNQNLAGNTVAFLATLLFAVHPLHTEAVSNIKGRDEILAMLGSIMTFLYVLRAWRCAETAVKSSDGARLLAKSKRLMVFATLTFLMGLFAKENAITFLAVIPLGFWFFTEAAWKDILRRMLPLGAAAIFFIIVRMLVLTSMGEKTNADASDNLVNNSFLVLSDSTRMEPLLEGSSVMKVANPSENTFVPMPMGNQYATVFYTWAVYLKLLFFPHPLTSDYYPRHIEVISFANPWVWFSILVHVGLLIWAAMGFKNKKPESFAILYYAVTFSIVSNLFINIGTNMSERFLFMPSLGFALLMALLAHRLAVWLSQKQGTSPDAALKGIVLVAVAVAACFSIKTIVRNNDWYDDYTLASADVKVSTESTRMNLVYAHTSLYHAHDAEMAALQESGGRENAETIKARENTFKINKEVLPYLEKCVKIHPFYFDGWLWYANSLYYLAGEHNLKAPKLIQALQRAQSSGNAGVAEKAKSELDALFNQTEQYYKTALAAYEQTNYFQPNHPEIRKLIGSMLKERGIFYKQYLNNMEGGNQILNEALGYLPNDRDIPQLIATGSAPSEAPIGTFAPKENGDVYYNRALELQNKAQEINDKAMLAKAEEQLRKALELYNQLPDNFPDKREKVANAKNVLMINLILQKKSDKIQELK